MGKIGRKISRAILVKKAWEKIRRKISRAVLVKKACFLNMFKIVRGTFWQKLVKNRGFRPNGHHEEFRSVKNIQNQPVRCQKALTRTLFRKTHFGPKPVPLPTMGRKSCPIKFPTPTAFLSGGNFIGTDRRVTLGPLFLQNAVFPLCSCIP